MTLTRLRRFRQILAGLVKNAKKRQLEQYRLAPEITAYVFSDSFALFMGVLVNGGGVQAWRAWIFPWHLRERIGILNTQTIADMSYAEFEEKVLIPQPLHRFPRQMARCVWEAAKRICDQYGGEVENIWATSSAKELEGRLTAFRGMGPKKAHMLMKILVRDRDHRFLDLSAVHIHYDLHIRRVLLRTGFMKNDSFAELRRVGSLLSPRYPAGNNDAIWNIGVGFCRPTKPDHTHCPFRFVCARKNISGTRELKRGTYN